MTPPVVTARAALPARTNLVITDTLVEPLTAPWGPLGWLAFLAAASGTGVLSLAIFWTFFHGIGAWGNNIPIAWAFGITNFVWWIGIGHAGTFISAFLLLLNQGWRTAINRLAEAMTIFAVMQAGLFPLLHLGRPWFAYWLVPYPATMDVWPNWKSALPWDFAAVSTYFTVSLLFWYTGLIPDFAAARARLPGTFRKKVYGVLSLGWKGSSRDWRSYKIAYGLFAGLATPLVISVHSIVSLDFATTQLPGWHSTIFPPYFVAGALFSGFAMTLTLVIPVRRFWKLEHVITEHHLGQLAKMLLLTGWCVILSYAIEFFTAWYSGDPVEKHVHFVAWPLGPYWPVFAVMMIGNVLAPQLCWSAKVRRSPAALFAISIAVNMGMWAERFMIVVGSLSRDFLPSSWGEYAPSVTDLGLLVGTISFFALLFLLFLKFVPVASLTELKEDAHAVEDARAAR
jgi:molybdopterin-containing oxidoreductase family membrane subunit